MKVFAKRLAGAAILNLMLFVSALWAEPCDYHYRYKPYTVWNADRRLYAAMPDSVLAHRLRHLVHDEAAAIAVCGTEWTSLLDEIAGRGASYWGAELTQLLDELEGGDRREASVFSLALLTLLYRVERRPAPLAWEVVPTASSEGPGFAVRVRHTDSRGRAVVWHQGPYCGWRIDLRMSWPLRIQREVWPVGELEARFSRAEVAPGTSVELDMRGVGDDLPCGDYSLLLEYRAPVTNYHRCAMLGDSPLLVFRVQ